MKKAAIKLIKFYQKHIFAVQKSVLQVLSDLFVLFDRGV